MSTITPSLQDFLPAARRHGAQASLVAEYCAFVLEQVPRAKKHDVAATLSMMCECTADTDSLLSELSDLLVDDSECVEDEDPEGLAVDGARKAKNNLIRDAKAKKRLFSLDAPMPQSDDAFIDVIVPPDLNPSFRPPAGTVDPLQVLLIREKNPQAEALRIILDITDSLNTRINTQRDLRNRVLDGLSRAAEFPEHFGAALELWVVPLIANATPRFHNKCLRETVRNALMCLGLVLGGDSSLYIQETIDEAYLRSHIAHVEAAFCAHRNRAARRAAAVAETSAHDAEPILVPDVRVPPAWAAGDPEGVALPDAVAVQPAGAAEPILVPDVRVPPAWAAVAVPPAWAAGDPAYLRGGVAQGLAALCTAEVSGHSPPWRAPAPARARAVPHRLDTPAVQTWLGGVGSSGRSPPWQHSPPPGPPPPSLRAPTCAALYCA